MITTERSQSLSEFRDSASDTLNRIKQTGEAEALTVNGEVRAVLLSPETYDSLATDAACLRDFASMRQALQEHREGKGTEVNEAFRPLREKLLAMQAAGLEKLPA